MSLYEILVLGEVPPEHFAALSLKIAAGVKEFGFRLGDEVQVRPSRTAPERDVNASTAVAYFAGQRRLDEELALHLLNLRIPTIPVAQPAGSFSGLLSGRLAEPNGIRLKANDDLEGLAAALLETVGLLRRQRRVFISYRQKESREAAVQLHDLLAERGFDAFLDTHSIRPGEMFQDMLWHRLTDSDVMIVLDTETYFQGRWTREEFGKALAKEIHILRLVWPGHKPTEHLSSGETVLLGPSDLTSRKCLKQKVAEDVACRVERIRSRSIAHRHRSLSGKFNSEVELVGGKIEAVGAHHAIMVRLPSGRRLWAYPAVGVPTALSLNDIANRTTELGVGRPILIYDHAGIHENWVKHLEWLDTNLAVVDAVKVFEAGLRLAELDS